MSRFEAFVLGVILSSLFFGYIIVTQFVAKKYLMNNQFYMNGAFYRLERVR